MFLTKLNDDTHWVQNVSISLLTSLSILVCLEENRATHCSVHSVTHVSSSFGMPLVSVVFTWLGFPHSAIMPLKLATSYFYLSSHLKNKTKTKLTSDSELRSEL